MASTSTPSFAPSSETVTLTPHDPITVFFKEEKVALQSKKHKTMINRCDDNDDDDDGAIGAVSAMFKVDDADGNQDNTKAVELLPDYLTTISAEISEYVNQYCKKHDDYSETDTRTTEEEQQLKKWDQEFIQKFDLNTLFDIMIAADHLNISSLLDLSSQSAADLMKDMSVEEVREIFGIINDFTPEEEEELRMENRWAFE